MHDKYSLFIPINLFIIMVRSFSECFFQIEWAWLAQLVRSLPSNHKVPGSIPGFAEISIFVQPSFPPKPTQLSILLG